MKIFSVLLILLLSGSIHAQDKPRSSITGDAGLSLYNMQRLYGWGTTFSAGYQYEVDKGIRFNPSLAMGFLCQPVESGKEVFKTFDFRLQCFADLIHRPSYSIFAGGGPFVNYSRGYWEGSDDDVLWGGYIDKWNGGMLGSIGFRAQLPKHNTEFYIVPLNLLIGPNFTSTSFRVGVDIKLGK